MSIYFSLVLTCGVSAVIRRIVCVLLQRMAKCLLRPSCLILLKNLFHQIIFLVVWDRANSSVSVLDVITVFCFVER